MVNSSPVPITVKMRSGPKAGEESYLQVGEMCQKAGATAVALHLALEKISSKQELATGIIYAD